MPGWLPGPTRRAHPGWAAPGRRWGSRPGSSWAQGRAAAPAGPPWCSGTGSRRPPPAASGRQTRLCRLILYGCWLLLLSIISNIYSQFSTGFNS